MDNVKCAQMDLLIELDRICKKWGISYFLTGGTLIGAIRHNGFIPWDDDLDVAMMQEDYDRLMEVLKTDLNPDYYLYNWHTDPATPLPFSKLKIRGTHYPEEVSANANIDDGIFIDIFPYDAAPETPTARKRQAVAVFLLRRILMLRAGFALGKGSFAKRLFYAFLKPLAFCRSMKSWQRSFEKVRRMGNNRDSEFVVCNCGAYSYDRELKPRKMMEGVSEHIFEGRMFHIPKNYDAFLRSHYGDYMQLPPEEQRVGIHNVQSVDFGEYTIRFHPNN